MMGKNAWKLFVWLLVFVACREVRAEEGAQKDAYAHWPPGWVSAYERFERFIAERKKTFPATDLQITSTGQILHSVRLFKATTEHLTMDIYTQGRSALGVTATESSKLEANSAFIPGLHVVVLKSCGFLGYQYLYPFLWLEITGKGKKRSEADPSFGFHWEPVAPPESQENYWPNERLFLFRDFCVMPHNNPFELYEKNVKVNPAVMLGLTDHGVLVRDPLPPDVEKLLVWRIYHNGRLVDKNAARDATRYSADHGQGTYQAFLCVDGPKGPMPVSNLVEFPLFEEKSGKRVVFPSTNQRLRFPDFLIDILTPTQLDQLYKNESETSKSANKRRYNIAAISVSTTYLNPYPTDPKTIETLALWQTWNIYLNDFLERAESAKGGIEQSWLWMIYQKE